MGGGAGGQLYVSGACCQLICLVPCSELAKEEEADAVLYRNTFGTQPKRALGLLQNAFDLYLKNPANTNVVLWGDRLLALWEVTLQLQHLAAALSHYALICCYLTHHLLLSYVSTFACGKDCNLPSLTTLILATFF